MDLQEGESSLDWVKVLQACGRHLFLAKKSVEGGPLHATCGGDTGIAFAALRWLELHCCLASCQDCGNTIRE